jgi:hypothetical protein
MSKTVRLRKILKDILHKKTLINKNLKIELVKRKTEHVEFKPEIKREKYIDEGFER